MIKRIIDWVLLIILIGTVIYAQVDGRFINNKVTIVEICNGEGIDFDLVLNKNNEPIDVINKTEDISVLGKYKRVE